MTASAVLTEAAHADRSAPGCFGWWSRHRVEQVLRMVSRSPLGPRGELLTSSTDSSPGIPTPSHLLRGRSRQLRFTVRRPPNGEVSPCSHCPSGGDVACSVHVGVAPTGSAGFALEDRLA